MKIIKSAAIAFSLTVAMGSFSTSAVAESDPGRVSHSPQNVIKEVDSRIDEALAAANNGASADDVAALSKKARDFTKELNANDKVARENEKVRNHLKNAEKACKGGSIEEAKEHFQKAKAANASLKSLL